MATNVARRVLLAPNTGHVLANSPPRFHVRVSVSNATLAYLWPRERDGRHLPDRGPSADTSTAMVWLNGGVGDGDGHQQTIIVDRSFQWPVLHNLRLPNAAQ